MQLVSDRPLTARALNGHVELIGTISFERLTPEAALASIEALELAADEAIRQREAETREPSVCGLPPRS